MHFRNKHLCLLLGFAASIVSHSDPTALIFLAVYHKSVSLCWLSWHCHTSSSGLACPSLELAGSGEGKWGVCCLHTLGNCLVLRAAEATDSQGCCRRRPGSFTIPHPFPSNRAFVLVVGGERSSQGEAKSIASSLLSRRLRNGDIMKNPPISRATSRLIPTMYRTVLT